MVQASKLPPFPPALNLARALPNLGHRFTFVSLRDGSEDSTASLGEASTHLRVAVGDRPDGRRDVRLLIQGPRLVLELRRALRDLRPDLVLACWGGGLLAVWLATPKGERGRLVYWANEFIRHDELQVRNPMRYVAWAERRLARKVPLVVVADPVRGVPQAEYLRVKDVVVVRNTPSVMPSRPGTSRLEDAVARIRAATPGATVFCFAGSICQGARVPQLLASFARWSDTSYLVLVGNVDPDIPDFERLLGLAGPRVTHLGMLPYEEVERGLPACDVGVAFYNTNWPWSNEIYCAPCKVGDYLKAGLALLVSNNPTLVGLLADFRLGVAVDPLDVDSIARGASELTRGLASGVLKREVVAEAFRVHLGLEPQLERLLRFAEPLAHPEGARP